MFPGTHQSLKTFPRGKFLRSFSLRFLVLLVMANSIPWLNAY